MRIYYKLLGGHYHCRVFFNGKAGDLVVADREWKEFQASFASHVRWIVEPE